MPCTLLRLFKYYVRRVFPNLKPTEICRYGFLFLILIFFMAGCNRKNLVNPVEEVPPQAAKLSCSFRNEHPGF